MPSTSGSWDSATHVQHASSGALGRHEPLGEQLVQSFCVVPATGGGLLQTSPPSPVLALLLVPQPSANPSAAAKKKRVPPDFMAGGTILERARVMTRSSVSFSDQVRAEARALGFDAVRIAYAGPEVMLEQDFARYEAFVAAGMQGEMGWLAKYAGVRARLDGEGILPGARSVICVARRYGGARGQGASPVVDGIARYARGRDYHAFLRRRLRRLASFVRSLGAPDGPLPEVVHARPLCDEEPVLERAWAARAGLGFIGKNGMLIIPGLGSMVLLGEVVTTLELEPDVARPTDRCGSCVRCLEACPTSAFEAPFVLDPRRCISYLTIEHRSAIAPELRHGVGAHLFGCDDCQTVCPFNAGVRARAPLDEADGDPFAPLERWSRVSLEELLSLDEAAWQAISEGTPLKRAGRAGLARNAALVLGNRGDASALPALRHAAGHHDDAMVRDAAAWAAQKVESRQDAKAPRG
jgi:epoxyqueuosine reductase